MLNTHMKKSKSTRSEETWIKWWVGWFLRVCATRNFALLTCDLTDMMMKRAPLTPTAKTSSTRHVAGGALLLQQVQKILWQVSFQTFSFLLMIRSRTKKLELLNYILNRLPARKLMNDAQQLDKSLPPIQGKNRAKTRRLNSKRKTQNQSSTSKQFVDPFGGRKYNHS